MHGSAAEASQAHLQDSGTYPHEWPDAMQQMRGPRPPPPPRLLRQKPDLPLVLGSPSEHPGPLGPALAAGHATGPDAAGAERRRGPGWPPRAAPPARGPGP